MADVPSQASTRKREEKRNPDPLDYEPFRGSDDNGKNIESLNAWTETVQKMLSGDVQATSVHRPVGMLLEKAALQAWKDTGWRVAYQINIEGGVLECAESIGKLFFFPFRAKKY
jgi:hypothetical protein